MKHKLLLTVFILLFSVIPAQIIKAVPSAPSPTCQISARVLNIEKVEETKDFKGNQLSNVYVYYKVNLNITSIDTIKQEGLYECDNDYITRAEDTFQTIKSEDYNIGPIYSGQIIIANIHFSGDEYRSGWYLSSIVDTSDKKSSTGPEEQIIISDNLWYYAIAVVIIMLALITIVVYKINHKNKKK